VSDESTTVAAFSPDLDGATKDLVGAAWGACRNSAEDSSPSAAGWALWATGILLDLTKSFWRYPAYGEAE